MSTKDLENASEQRREIGRRFRLAEKSKRKNGSLVSRKGKKKFGLLKLVEKPVIVEFLKDRSHQNYAKVRFGSVIAANTAPTFNVVQSNINAGRSAMSRSKDVLVTGTGIKLNHGKTVPIYKSDPNDSSILIRVTNGREERVKFDRKKLAFVVINA